MGRKVHPRNVGMVIKLIQENDGQLRANDVAKQLGVHPQAIARLLPAIEENTGDLLQEDDKGFLGIFKKSKR